MKHWMWKSGLMISLVSGGLTAVAADGQRPSADFLAYLADMEKIDGQWVDPMTLEEMTLPEREQTDDSEPPASENPEGPIPKNLNPKPERGGFEQ